MPDGIEDLIAAFTEEVEASNARLADGLRDTTTRLEAAVEQLSRQVATMAEAIRTLEARVDVLESHALSPPDTARADGGEAGVRMRFRHPEIWEMLQAGLPLEEIARASSRTLGEIRLIARLMGQGDS